MEITRVTVENAEFFDGLVPAELLADETLLHLGVIAEDGMACGGLSAGVMDGMAFLEWLYIAPDRRRQGFASELLGTLMLLLKRIRAEGLEVSFTRDAEGLEDFLEERAFLVGGDSQVYAVPVNDLIHSITMERIVERQQSLGRVFTLSRMMNHQALARYLQEKGVEASHLQEISPECSFARMNQKNEITGCMLIRRQEDEDPEVTWLFNDQGIDGLEELFATFRNVMLKRDLEGETLIFADRDGQIMDYIELVTEEGRDLYRTIDRKYAVRIIG